MSRYREDGGFYDPQDQGPGNRGFSFGRSRPAFKGGGGGGTTTTRVELPDYVRPYAERLMDWSYNLAQQPTPQYGGQLTAGLNQDHTTAMNGIRDRALNGSPDINAAREGLTSTLQGQYMRGAEANPYTGQANTYMGQGNAYMGQANAYAGPNAYLDNAIQKTQGDIARNYAAGTGAQTLAQFRNSGAFGGSAMQETQDTQNRALGDALANASSSMRMQDYDIQRQISAQDLARNAQLAGQDLDRNASMAGQDLARNAQLAESQLSRGDSLWNSERQRQLQAMGLAPNLANTDYQNYQALLGIGDIQRDYSQSQLNDALTRWQQAANQPYQQMELLASGIMGATGGGVAKNQVGPNPNQVNRTAGALGGAMSGAGLGSMFGPWGTAIGGGLGLLGGLFG
ncbi:hypothetical protein RAS14_04620 [Achromobacter aegrifaciens]|uniref:hypothetical protein n=1 Tax=Achromobacter aegrifaciens TaxID=1287736 RepID=UPI002794B55E|nr:hypothetical protein [Achromobacter aegrifaciens]MDQ1759022.1 hypothetical protein [Achromobacter aegrifaciens]